MTKGDKEVISPINNIGWYKGWWWYTGCLNNKDPCSCSIQQAITAELLYNKTHYLCRAETNECIPFFPKKTKCRLLTCVTMIMMWDLSNIATANCCCKGVSSCDGFQSHITTDPWWWILDLSILSIVILWEIHKMYFLTKRRPKVDQK